MKRQLLFFVLLLCPWLALANTGPKNKTSTYKITSRFISKDLNTGEAEIKIKFKGQKEGSTIYVNNQKGEIDKRFNTDHFAHKIKPGKHVFILSALGCRILYTDTIEVKANEVIEMQVHFLRIKKKKSTNFQHRKPVIYLYTDSVINAKVNIDFNGEFIFTYPVYKNGWNCTVSPGGKILVDEKEYNYLFWEGESDKSDLSAELKKDDGFIVSKNELLSFLENSLTQMGLNTKEQQDFITYWYPQMIKNESNHIRFLFKEEYEKYARLNITPTPENIFRVFMLWEKANEKKELTPQIFPSFSRNGFTVVEWGGSEITEILH